MTSEISEIALQLVQGAPVLETVCEVVLQIKFIKTSENANRKAKPMKILKLSLQFESVRAWRDS